jgi:regulator of extracellular matrix RemA (YlzA/DUF370 family)
MYLHIGTNVLLRTNDIIAIIGRKGDADKRKINRAFLQKKQDSAQLINISSNNDKSFVLTADEKVYISPISPYTLKKRSQKNDFQEG